MIESDSEVEEDDGTDVALDKTDDSPGALTKVSKLLVAPGSDGFEQGVITVGVIAAVAALFRIAYGKRAGPVAVLGTALSALVFLRHLAHRRARSTAPLA